MIHIPGCSGAENVYPESPRSSGVSGSRGNDESSTKDPAILGSLADLSGLVYCGRHIKVFGHGGRLKRDGAACRGSISHCHNPVCVRAGQEREETYQLQDKGAADDRFAGRTRSPHMASFLHERTGGETSPRDKLKQSLDAIRALARLHEIQAELSWHIAPLY